MKIKETILDIVGVALLILSIWAYFFKDFGFNECTMVGVSGLALFILKGSVIRKFVTKLIDKYLTKLIDKYLK